MASIPPSHGSVISVSTFPIPPVLPPRDYRDRFQEQIYNVPAFDKAELKSMSKQMRKQVAQGYSDHLTDDEKQTMIQDYYAFCAYGDSLMASMATSMAITLRKSHPAKFRLGIM